MPPVVWRSNIKEIGAAALYDAELAPDDPAGRLLRRPTRPHAGAALLVPEPRGAVLPGVADRARRGRGCRRAGSTRHGPESCRGRRLGRRSVLPGGLLCRPAGAERRRSSAPGPGRGSSHSVAWSPWCRRWPFRAHAGAGCSWRQASWRCWAHSSPCRTRPHFPAGSPSSRRWVPRSSSPSAAVARGRGGSFGWTPVQWIGDHSYSIYLWHWPPLVAVPWIVHGDSATVCAWEFWARPWSWPG